MKEIFEAHRVAIMPTLAHRYFSVIVIFAAYVFWIIAALVHSVPCTINLCSAHAVFERDVVLFQPEGRYFITITPARNDTAARKTGPASNKSFAAIAKATPIRISIGVEVRKLQNVKLSKSLVFKVFSDCAHAVNIQQEKNIVNA